MSKHPLDTILTTLVSRLNAFTGLHLEVEHSGTPDDQSKVVMTAADLFALAGLVDLAQAGALAAAEDAADGCVRESAQCFADSIGAATPGDRRAAVALFTALAALPPSLLDKLRNGDTLKNAAAAANVFHEIASEPTATDGDQRAKWAEAGRKSWETRRRNEAAKKRASKRK